MAMRNSVEIMKAIREVAKLVYPKANVLYIAGSYPATLSACVQQKVWSSGAELTSNDIDVYVMDQIKRAFREGVIEILGSHYTKIEVGGEILKINWVEIKPMRLVAMLKNFDLNCCRVGVEISDEHKPTFELVELQEFSDFLRDEIIEPIFPLKNEAETALRMLYKALQQRLKYSATKMDIENGTLTQHSLDKLKKLQSSNMPQPDYLQNHLVASIGLQTIDGVRQDRYIFHKTNFNVQTTWGSLDWAAKVGTSVVPRAELQECK